MSPDTENSHPEQIEPAEAELEATDELNTQNELGEDDRLAELEAQCEAMTLKYQRALADFQNFQRRSLQNEVRVQQVAKAAVLRDVLPILDNLDLALGQQTPEGASDGIQQGVVIVRDELLKMLGSHGVSPIQVQPGDEFDPNAHEAMMHVEADGVDEGHVAQLLQVGYAMADIILRPAKVSVARGDG